MGRAVVDRSPRPPGAPQPRNSSPPTVLRGMKRSWTVAAHAGPFIVRGQDGAAGPGRPPPCTVSIDLLISDARRCPPTRRRRYHRRRLFGPLLSGMRRGNRHPHGALTRPDASPTTHRDTAPPPPIPASSPCRTPVIMCSPTRGGPCEGVGRAGRAGRRSRMTTARRAPRLGGRGVPAACPRAERAAESTEGCRLTG